MLQETTEAIKIFFLKIFQEPALILQFFTGIVLFSSAIINWLNSNNSKKVSQLRVILDFNEESSKLSRLRILVEKGEQPPERYYRKYWANQIYQFSCLARWICYETYV